IDMPPTLLSLIGVNAVSPMIGRDMTKPLGRAQERAMMQFDKNYGYLTRDSLVVFSPGEKVATYHYNFNDNSYEPVQLRQEDIDTAKANALFGSMAYQNDWYQTNSP
ncbi:LTA synthase family protein, partial [Vibrio vulnificus]|nr:LTA synthase family protein [Vibrio vulnificus]EIV8492661.1 LTA synthase family protein [Vibrio vulnificus]EME0911818.1 LTA synthase family protein [Vibrio vulnificus]